MKKLLFATAFSLSAAGHAAPLHVDGHCTNAVNHVSTAVTACPRPLSTQRLVLPPTTLRT